MLLTLLEVQLILFYIIKIWNTKQGISRSFCLSFFIKSMTAPYYMIFFESLLFFIVTDSALKFPETIQYLTSNTWCCFPKSNCRLYIIFLICIRLWLMCVHAYLCVYPWRQQEYMDSLRASCIDAVSSLVGVIETEVSHSAVLCLCSAQSDQPPKLYCLQTPHGNY